MYIIGNASRLSAKKFIHFIYNQTKDGIPVEIILHKLKLFSQKIYIKFYEITIPILIGIMVLKRILYLSLEIKNKGFKI